MAPAYPHSAGSNNGNTLRVPRRAATVVYESTDFSTNKDGQNVVQRVCKERDPRGQAYKTALGRAPLLWRLPITAAAFLSLSLTHARAHPHTVRTMIVFTEGHKIIGLLVKVTNHCP